MHPYHQLTPHQLQTSWKSKHKSLTKFLIYQPIRYGDNGSPWRQHLPIGKKILHLE